MLIMIRQVSIVEFVLVDYDYRSIRLPNLNQDANLRLRQVRQHPNSCDHYQKVDLHLFVVLALRLAH
jgi:hypothetical protein